MRKSSTACSPRRTTASAGAATGWTWRATPTATASRPTRRGRNIWRYRDYVIQAFNEDKPYDRFVREQIAGDELYPGDPDALVAMGFNRHWIDESNAAGLITRRQETLDDITDT